ncbi:histidine utilization repressor [Sporolactobacillus inulinus]|uniref:Histidine utilization repressor n=1 Tax=Sporolactobacillus inulinus TaxID=2078 RepID=A0A4Y1ZJ76_9BACL|nr:UTRA domain-containing protein [Sporolactobacillus inulinus]GAY79090.1 histidine utilization repressor [Sporolactobacillus inulinus]
MLNNDNLFPLYMQVKRKIIEAINDSTYSEGTRLPSETELLDTYNVSRVTIRRALQELVREGYLIRKQGKGTFIKHKKITRSLLSADGYTEYMKKTGEKPERKIIEKSIKVCSPLISKRLSISPQSKILELFRVMYIKDVPLGYEVTSYPVLYFDGLENDINDRVSTHELLKKKYGTVLEKSQKMLNVILASETMAGYLKCHVSDPVYQLEKTAFNQYGLPVYHSMMYYDVNRVSFVIDD